MFHDKVCYPGNNNDMTRKGTTTGERQNCRDCESFDKGTPRIGNPVRRKLVRSNSQVITSMFQVSTTDDQKCIHSAPSIENKTNSAFKYPLKRTDSISVIPGPTVNIPPKAAAVTGALSHKPPVPPQAHTAVSMVPPKIRTPLRQKSLASFVHKHFLNMQSKLQGLNSRNNADSPEHAESLSKSCPNLAPRTTGQQPVKAKVRVTLSNDSACENRRRHDNSSPTHRVATGGTPRHLEVPNLFITSQTHSKHVSETIEQVGLDESKGQRDKVYPHSAPELRPAQVSNGDDTDQTRTTSTYREISSVRNIDVYYRDGFLSQILDFLFVGNIEAAFHERLLCKLKIEGMVDVSCISPEDIPSNKKKEYPCTCPRDTRHLRPSLRINLSSIEINDMYEYFEEINRFIEGLRKNGKRVLVYCVSGKCQSPAIIMQYVMSHRNLNLRRTFDLVKSHKPEVQLTETFQLVLKRLERRLRQRGHLFKTSMTPEKERLETVPFHESATDSHRKIAWPEFQ